MMRAAFMSGTPARNKLEAELESAAEQAILDWRRSPKSGEKWAEARSAYLGLTDWGRQRLRLRLSATDDELKRLEVPKRDHVCEFPTVDYVPYGESWECPVCRRKYAKAEYEGGCAYWEVEG